MCNHSLNFSFLSFREEEIVATNIAEELISTTMDDEVDMKTAQSNAYVIQSSVDGIDMVPEKPSEFS